VFKVLFRALRLPFISACLFPYVFGSLRSGRPFDWICFVLGVITVAGTHLSANLINDVADAHSGVDQFDQRFFGFFGGSKLIQEGRLSIRWYRRAAVLSALCAGTALLAITFRLGRWETPFLFAFVLGLAWQYSCPPLALAYRGFGESAVFLLFGPASVAGGFYFAGAGYPTFEQWTLSLPFGFLTAAILIANEVPDAREDARGGKRTLVVSLGSANGWLGFAVIEALAWFSILLSWFFGFLKTKTTAASLLGLPLVFISASILRQHWDRKERLIVSSKLAIATQVIVGSILIVGEFF